MKKLSILDILQNIDISSKYKHINKNNNRINAEALMEDPLFKKIFKMKFLELCLLYYNDE